MTYGISVIIPTYNEEKYIEKSILSIFTELKNIEIPHEVIVVDNLSSDNTASIIDQLPVIHLTCNQKGNPSATRNIGARLAQYEILCFIDGDCLVTQGWANQIIQTFADPDVAAFGGPALSPENGNWIEKSWAATALKPYTHEYSSLPGANFCIRKTTFDALQGFDENLVTAEDDDLSKRVINTGKKSIATSQHPVIHLGYPKTLFDIYKKQIWHGSSQLKAHGFFGDKMVILTIFWMASIFGVLIAGFISKTFFAACMLFFAICPMIVAKKRTQNFKIINVSTLFNSYIISWFFLAGRSAGLAIEVLKRVKS